MEHASLPVGGSIARAPEHEAKLGPSSGVTCLQTLDFSTIKYLIILHTSIR